MAAQQKGRQLPSPTWCLAPVKGSFFLLLHRVLKEGTLGTSFLLAFNFGSITVLAAENS